MRMKRRETQRHGVERRSQVRPRMGKAGLLELQFQWVRTVTSGKDAATRIPVSRGVR